MTGLDGLRRARRDGADLVLLDLMLPDVEGLEVCRRLRRDPSTARVPVIMVTAKGEESDIVLGLGVGAARPHLGARRGAGGGLGERREHLRR